MTVEQLPPVVRRRTRREYAVAFLFFASLLRRSERARRTVRARARSLCVNTEHTLGREKYSRGGARAKINFRHCKMLCTVYECVYYILHHSVVGTSYALRQCRSCCACVSFGWAIFVCHSAMHACRSSAPRRWQSIHIVDFGVHTR